MREVYRFNPETCSYERVKSGFLVRLAGLVPYAALSLLVAIGLVSLFYAFYDSPQTRLLKREKAQLDAQLHLQAAKADTMRIALASLENRNKALYRQILDAEPVDPDSSSPENGANIPAGAADSIKGEANQNNIDELTSRVDALSNALQEQSQANSVLVELTRLKQKELAFIPSIRPVPTEIISGFGLRRHPVFKKDVFHAGIDFKADIGTRVVATANGVISRQVLAQGKSMGTTLVIDHRNGYTTTYAHLQRIVVRPGQQVKRGQLIGYSGNSGLTKGPHLFYEIDKAGKPIDPIDYFFNDLKPDQLSYFRRSAAQYNESMS